MYCIQHRDTLLRVMNYTYYSHISPIRTSAMVDRYWSIENGILLWTHEHCHMNVGREVYCVDQIGEFTLVRCRTLLYDLHILIFTTCLRVDSIEHYKHLRVEGLEYD